MLDFSASLTKNFPNLILLFFLSQYHSLVIIVCLTVRKSLTSKMLMLRVGLRCFDGIPDFAVLKERDIDIYIMYAI